MKGKRTANIKGYQRGLLSDFRISSAVLLNQGLVSNLPIPDDMRFKDIHLLIRPEEVNLRFDTGSYIMLGIGEEVKHFIPVQRLLLRDNVYSFDTASTHRVGEIESRVPDHRVADSDQAIIPSDNEGSGIVFSILSYAFIFGVMSLIAIPFVAYFFGVDWKAMIISNLVFIWIILKAGKSFSEKRSGLNG